MTKSKGIGRGGRRKGAGRPRLAKTSKASYFSTRITPKTRNLLEAEAHRSGESLAVVAEHLLNIGLEEKAERRDRKKGPLRALCFLIDTLSRSVRSNRPDDPKFTWHSNPYAFEAFRAAVLHLLDVLKPPGPVVVPSGPTRGLAMAFTDSPEKYGRFCVEMLRQTIRFHSDIEETGAWGDILRSPHRMREHYGLIDAKQDLDLKIPGEEEAG
jgi:hypothetical protein